MPKMRSAIGCLIQNLFFWKRKNKKRKDENRFFGQTETNDEPTLNLKNRIRAERKMRPTVFQKTTDSPMMLVLH